MISVNVDSRIELLSAVQLLSSWRKIGIWSGSYSYKEDMIDFFSKHRDHRAVRLFEDLLKRGFSYDAPVGFMMHLSNPPELKVARPISDYHIRRAHDAEILRNFSKALHYFSSKVDFNEFWDRHIDFYKTFEEKTASEVKLDQLVDSLERYFGVSHHGYYLVLAPLFQGSYGYSMKINGSSDIYAFLGPMRVKDNIPVFGGALFHEFAHSFVNPVTKRFRKQLRGGNILFKPIKRKMIRMAYGNWETMINEHVIRAVDFRVVRKKSSEEFLDRQQRSGFVYIKPISNLLEQYEKQRSTYPTFQDFFPKIAELLSNISDVVDAMEYLRHPKGRFEGPINGVFEYKDYSDRILIVEPTGIRDEELRKKTGKYLDDMQAFMRRNHSAKVSKATDVKTLKMDLKDKIPIIYGTVKSNKLLQKFAGELPFSISREGVKLGKKFHAGKDLRFITAYFNPMNKELPMLIYTATSDEGIIDINSIFHGPTDYILIRGREVVIQGNYKKNENWSFVEKSKHKMKDAVG